MKTAVIAPTEQSFKDCCMKYNIEDPAWIRTFDDINDDYINIRRGVHHSRVLNHKRLYDRCKERIAIRFGVICAEEWEFKKYVKTRKKEMAVWINSLESANRWWYIDVVYLSTAKSLDCYIDIMCAVEARYASEMG